MSGYLIKPEPGAMAALLANIQAVDTHLTTGAVGARWILQALTARPHLPLRRILRRPHRDFANSFDA